jgi:uncharacterized OB-fold protein
MPEPVTSDAVFGPVPAEPRWVDDSVVTRVDGRWRLLGSRCRACDARFFPRAYTCASCLARDLEPVPLSVHGVVHVSATAGATQPGFAAPARFAWVDLPAEGARVFAHLVPVGGPEPGRGERVVFDPVVVGSDGAGPLCSIAFRIEGREGR